MTELIHSPLPPARDPREQDLPGQVYQLIGALRQGWRLIGISALVCVTLAGLYLAQAKRIYQAEARLLVLQMGGRPLNVANSDPNRIMEGTEDYIPTHSLILGSPLVVKRALDRVGLENLPTLRALKRAGDDPVERAINSLKVTRPDRQAKILRVEYRAGDRDEAVRTVEAITDSYRQFLEETFQKNSSTAIALITKARDELSRELAGLEAQYLELRRKTPALMATGEDGRSLMAQRLSSWDKAANEAQIKAAQLKAQLELGRRLTREGAELWAVAHAISQLGGDTGNLTAATTSGASQSGATDYVRQLKHEQQQLVERFGPGYARVRELQVQIDRIQERVRGARGSEAKDLLGALEQSLQSVRAMRVELAEESERQQEKAKQVQADLLAEANLRDKVERQRSLFNTVVEQLKQAQFVSDYSSIAAQVIEPPKTPDRPVWPRVGLTLALALVVGCMLGGGAVLVLDRLDQRVRSLEELRQLTGLAVLGRVALLPEGRADEKDQVGLISYLQPHCPAAEAYRAIRTSIDFLRRRDERLRVLLVTSPHPGDGKTTSASNLAISFALAGRKVLLIDADLRRPRQHKVHGLDRERGFSHLIKDLLPLHRVVQQSRVESLDVITTGPDVPNPAELLSSPRLAELLDEARQSYDLVLIDSPPLLAVADPVIVGAVADGVVLVVRPATLRRREAECAVERLGSLGTSLLGVVVNGISHDNSGYGYDYGYGYGRYGRQHERRPGATTGSNGADGPPPEALAQANGRPDHDPHDRVRRKPPQSPN